MKKNILGEQRIPNVLLIVTDQQRYDCIGYAGDGILQTPNLDRLAKRGVIFTNCYTSWPVCTPARATLLSGRYAHKTGVYLNKKSLPQDHFSLPRFLKESSYDTALIGKMHLKPIHAEIGFQKMEMAEHDPTQKGCFVEDEYHAWLEKEGIDDWQEKFQYPSEYPQAPEEYKKNLQAVAFPYEEKYHSTTWISGRAVQYLKNRNNPEPFFLCLSFLKPHHPFNPLPRFLQMYDTKNIPLPDRRIGKLTPGLEEDFYRRIAHGVYDLSNFDADLCRKIIAHYYATITHIDEAVGRILEQIDLSNTLVVFTSDHGDYLGRRNRILKDPNLPLDDLARIPLFFSGAGIPAGRVHQDPVEIGDIVPTLLSLCGLEIPDGVDVDGCDLTSCFHHAHCPEPRPVFSRAKDWSMVRQGPWKYMENEADLSLDPQEKRNLLREEQDFSEIVAYLRPQLLKIRKCNN